MDKLAVELRLHLAPFARRLRLRDGLHFAQRSLWAACLAGALIQLAGRIWPVERLWLWTMSPMAAWILIVLGNSLLRALPPVRVARRIDTELGLKERLATALALENLKSGKPSEPEPGTTVADHQPPSPRTYRPTGCNTFQPSLVALQRQDAVNVASSIQARQALPLPWLRGPLIVAAVFASVIAILATVPNPMQAVLAERAAIAQATEEQAKQIEELHEEIEHSKELTPEMREELLRQLAELARRLRHNPSDREDALARLSRSEENLRPKLDPYAHARRAALEALATQLQNLARSQTNETAHLAEAANDLEELAESIANLDADKRESLAASLAQASAHVARAGDSDLAQALAALAQAARLGAGEPAAQAARDAVDALAEAQGKLADQAALQRTLSQLQAGRQAIAKAGQGQAVAQGQGRGPSQSQGQGQGQQGQPGAGGGTKADRLPPARRSGQAGLPQGEGQPGSLGEFNQQIYVPRERRQGSGDQLTISGQETGQGDIQIGNQGDPLPGSAGQALVPYQEVYHNYLDAVNQTMERSYIPSGLKDYVREYFSQLEP